MKRSSSLFFSILLSLPLFATAQKGTISGKIIDAKLAEGLIGCSVRLDDGAGGAITDFDGNYLIQNVTPGVHRITITYTGYSTKTIEPVTVKEGEATTVDVALEDATSQVIAEVVVTATAQRSSMSALTILQKNSTTIADGISAETIKRTPDRTTGDVIKRVSGASIQDNRFAVIRGLADRYNIAMMNGALLSSTEPDRRAFSFDLFPSSMLDNLIVVKTASPDLPGEFAGGAILLNTKDIPEDNYLHVSASGGYNTRTTFKPSLGNTVDGGTDWLGIDDGSRALPAEMPSREEYLKLPADEKYRISRAFPNDWGLQSVSSTAPNASLQIGSGLIKKFSDERFWGTTMAISYNSSYRAQVGERNDFEGTVENPKQMFHYQDNLYKHNILWGALLNTAFNFNTRNRLSFQNTYSTNSDFNIVDRIGQNFDNEESVRASSDEYVENHLLTSRLSGEHLLTKNGLKLNWGGGYNRTSRDVPSTKRMYYSRDINAAEEDPYYASVPIGATPGSSGRFYSNLVENVWNGNADLAFPFAVGGEKQTFKIGGLYQGKDRAFGARVIGVVAPRPNAKIFQLRQLPQDQIFAPENFGTDLFIIDDITTKSDNYTAASTLSGGYAMFDNKLWERFRLSWGVRIESFQQELHSIDQTQQPVDVNRTSTDVLPSANLKFELNEKTNLRLSVSQTVTRPEFREIAPFSFYDFYLQRSIVGNPNLRPGKIFNGDLRYELYPGMNQLFSFSVFYKKFTDPIERVVNRPSAGTTVGSFKNISAAQSFGVEMEVRKNFGFFGERFESLVVFGNIALIHSEINLDSIESEDKSRPLQGQSPYVANAGLQWNWKSAGLNATIVYNIIGDRLFDVGFKNYADTYEQHRDLLDFSISKNIGRRGEIKLTWSDILRQPFIYYQDNNFDHKYNDGDNLMQKNSLGSTITLSAQYRF